MNAWWQWKWVHRQPQGSFSHLFTQYLRYHFYYEDFEILQLCQMPFVWQNTTTSNRHWMRSCQPRRSHDWKGREREKSLKCTRWRWKILPKTWKRREKRRKKSEMKLKRCEEKKKCYNLWIALSWLFNFLFTQKYTRAQLWHVQFNSFCSLLQAIIPLINRMKKL